MSSRKIMQAPGLSRDPYANRRPPQRGFWDWVYGIGHLYRGG